MRWAPTIESATWCETPASASAASWLRVEVVKNSSTAWSSQDGALVTSTTTRAPASASLRHSPVGGVAPVCGEAGTASWPWARRLATTLDPICPVPPMTTIFMVLPFGQVDCLHQPRPGSRSGRDGECQLRRIGDEEDLLHAGRRHGDARDHDGLAVASSHQHRR